MKDFISLSLSLLGLVSIVLGLAIIIRDRLVSRVYFLTLTTQRRRTPLDAIINLINALANFAEKLFGQFTSKEKLPVFLIVIGLVMCGVGKWLAS